mmetsp:Transcript_46407/g.75438  ORF Transcript_46407/g.75438 Transcript_46407/m.75438 type:complete len:223 (-) Transcript_46407:718-1386(-)
MLICARCRETERHHRTTCGTAAKRGHSSASATAPLTARADVSVGTCPLTTIIAIAVPRSDIHALLLKVLAELIKGCLLLLTAGSQLREDLLECPGVHTNSPCRPTEAGARKPVGGTDHLYSLHRLMVLQAALGQNSVELVVHGAAFCHHGLVNGQCFLKALVLKAGMNQTSVDLNVWSKPVLLADILHHLKGHGQASRVSKHFHQNAKRIVGGLDACQVHLF